MTGFLSRRDFCEDNHDKKCTAQMCMTPLALTYLQDYLSDVRLRSWSLTIFAKHLADVVGIYLEVLAFFLRGLEADLVKNALHDG